MVLKTKIGKVELDFTAFRIVPSMTCIGQNKGASDRAKTSLGSNFLVNRADSMYLKLTKETLFSDSLR